MPQWGQIGSVKAAAGTLESARRQKTHAGFQCSLSR